MSDSKKWTIVALAAVALSSAAMAFDPAWFEPDVEFTIVSPKDAQPWYRNNSRRAGRGPIHPTHKVGIQIYGRHTPVDFSGSEGLQRLLQTPSGLQTSTQQRQFMAKCDSMFSSSSGGSSATLSVTIYAVSLDDARKMAMALVEALTTQVAEARAAITAERDAARRRIEDIDAARPGKQQAADQAQTRYDAARKHPRYMFLSETEARNAARDTVTNLVTELDSLKVSVAGIEEQIKTIHEAARRSGIPQEIGVRLLEMEIEKQVELSGIEAQIQAAQKIIDEAVAFYDTLSAMRQLKDEINQMHNQRRSLERDLDKLNAALNDRENLELIPPELRGKVAIYTVEQS